MSIAVTINGASEAGAALAALGAQLKSPAGLLKVLEREGRNLLVAHFRKRNTVPNKLGGRRTNFWQSVADSVTTSLGGFSVTWSVTHPTFRQKVQGGTIVPKAAKLLTIPVNPAAYGLRARVLEQSLGIKLVLIKSGTRFGVLAAQTFPGSKIREVFYILRDKVTQAPDPDALPPREQFLGALVARATAYVGRLTTKPA